MQKKKKVKSLLNSKMRLMNGTKKYNEIHEQYQKEVKC